MSNDSPHAPHRPPHPLALELIERLRGRPGARVLEIGAGSGRNTRALAAAGLAVQTLPATDCAGAISTHALLHGTRESLAAQLAQIARSLERDAPLYATFGSVRDARYGKGRALEPHVFAPLDGDEIGVPHAYFDEARLRALLAPYFTIESIYEAAVDEIAGSWAHPAAPLRNAVHWFVIASARSDQ